jgi:hypothetical protein
MRHLRILEKLYQYGCKILYTEKPITVVVCSDV